MIETQAHKMTKDLTEFGSRLKDLRIQLGMTQPELAALLEVKRQTIASWEQGATAPDVPRLYALKHHAAKEGVSVSLGELLGEAANRRDSPLGYVRDLLRDVDDMGVRGIFHNRSTALDAFRPALEREVDAITIVSSSFTGVVRVATAQVSQLLKEAAQKVRQFRILMTEPSHFSPLREAQEGRREGSIRSEISENVERLISDWGIDESNIRFYKGAPTVFLLFTSDRMLVNPYTYQTEAYKTLTLEVAKTGNIDDIYSQYAENHFQRPWEGNSSVACKDVIAELRANSKK